MFPTGCSLFPTRRTLLGSSPGEDSPWPRAIAAARPSSPGLRAPSLSVHTAFVPILASHCQQSKEAHLCRGWHLHETRRLTRAQPRAGFEQVGGTHARWGGGQPSQSLVSPEGRQLGAREALKSVPPFIRGQSQSRREIPAGTGSRFTFLASLVPVSWGRTMCDCPFIVVKYKEYDPGLTLDAQTGR